MKKRGNPFSYLKIICISLLILVPIVSYLKVPDESCRDCNVIMISIDTLRADHLGMYGYHRNTSPFLDKFAEKSLVFESKLGESLNLV